MVLRSIVLTTLSVLKMKLNFLSTIGLLKTSLIQCKCTNEVELLKTIN